MTVTIKKLTDKGRKQLDKCLEDLKDICEVKFGKCDCGTAVITSASGFDGAGSLVGTKLVDVRCPENVTDCDHGVLNWTCAVQMAVVEVKIVAGKPVPVGGSLGPEIVALKVTIHFYTILGFPVLRQNHAFLRGGGMGGEQMFGNGKRGPVCKCDPGGCACRPGLWAQTIAANRFGLGTGFPDRSAASAFWLDPILKHFAVPRIPEVEESAEPVQFSEEVDRHTVRPMLS